MYVCHAFVGEYADQINHQLVERSWFNIVCVLLTIALSAFLLYAIILPVCRLRSRFGARKLDEFAGILHRHGAALMTRSY